MAFNEKLWMVNDRLSIIVSILLRSYLWLNKKIIVRSAPLLVIVKFTRWLDVTEISLALLATVESQRNTTRAIDHKSYLRISNKTLYEVPSHRVVHLTSKIERFPVNWTKHRGGRYLWALVLFHASTRSSHLWQFTFTFVIIIFVLFV